MLVFESTALVKSIDKTNCTLAMIPKELITGVNSENDQFLGLANLHSVLINFKNESEFLGSQLQVNFMNISESGVDNDINDTIQSTQSFASQNKSIIINININFKIKRLLMQMVQIKNQFL